MSVAAEADADAVRVAIVAETARAYADAASAAERLAVATRIVALLDRSLKVTSRRVEVGMTTRLDTARIAALRHQRQAEIPAIAAERDSALFRLAMLTGRAPAELPPTAGARNAALQLNRPIPVGDGAQLLARRPDIRAAERRLAAATARIGVATADLYPRISLGGSVGSTAGSIGDLFSGPIGWLLGPLISWSFTDHARARARVAGAEADAAGGAGRISMAPSCARCRKPRPLCRPTPMLSSAAKPCRPRATKRRSRPGLRAPSSARGKWIRSPFSTPNAPMPSKRPS